MIKVGSTVRSYDNRDRRNHGIIGRVVALSVTEVPEPHAPGGVWTFDCPRYAIMCDRIFDSVKGERPHPNPGQIVYPPMNGTKCTDGDICNEVELYENSTD